MATRSSGWKTIRAATSFASISWAPTTILRGDIVSEVARLKTVPGKELQLHGSARLAQSLLTAGLIDEIRLVITPTVLGQGRRLFPGHGPATGMRVTTNITTPAGLTVLILQTTDAPLFAAYEGVSAVPR